MSSWLNIPPLGFPIFSYLIIIGTGAIVIAMFIRIVLSWFGLDERNGFVLFMARITDPFVTPIRRYVRPIGFMDFSWLIATVLLLVVRQLLLQAMPPGW
jgi:YggT family protein